MSTAVADLRGRFARLADGAPLARAVALVGVALVLGAFLSVLHEILVITGEPRRLYYVVGGAVLAGTGLARVIRPRAAAGLGVAGIVAGMYLYVTSLPGGFGFLALLVPMLDDVVALLSGLSVLRIVNADVWALAASPAPVFLAWYLAVRRRYVAASGVAGAGLLLVVLTGDAGTATTLVGVLGVTLAVAFGDFDRRGERLYNADGLVVLLSAMVLLTLGVGIVPGAAGSFVSTDGVGTETSTVESSLVYAGDSVTIAGEIELSPEVRYTVEADERAYWRVSTYDRYTGGGWVRTGERRRYQGDLREPPGRTRTVEQTYTAETDVATLPAANGPTEVRGVPVPVQVDEAGALQPAGPLQANESYTVVSERPAARAGTLREAGTDYPDGVEERYTQLPSSSPERVAERTDRLTANAENPYDTARVLERYLENNYAYSLEVERPRGDVADRFLFEMDAGYCTYFATTMVTMLRTQDVPARFAVGYTPGQRVGDDEWVVRGYDSHAWVEVYFPEQGWVRFDPTPSSPRERTERQRLEDARTDGSPAIDTGASADSEYDSGTPEPRDDENGTAAAAGRPGGSSGSIDRSSSVDPGSTETGTEDEGPLGGASVPVPTPQQAGFGLVVLAGVAAVGRRTGIDRRIYREAWLRRLPDGTPEEVVVGAFRRVVHLEERAGREREPGETARSFLAHSGRNARRVRELHEQARYGHGVDEADADEAAERLAALLERRSRLPHLVEKPGERGR